MSAIRTELRTEMPAMRADQHKDWTTLMQLMIPLHERMAKIESAKSSEDR